jgi:hypothetical protein
MNFQVCDKLSFTNQKLNVSAQPKTSKSRPPSSDSNLRSKWLSELTFRNNNSSAQSTAQEKSDASQTSQINLEKSDMWQKPIPKKDLLQESQPCQLNHSTLTFGIKVVTLM